MASEIDTPDKKPGDQVTLDNGDTATYLGDNPSGVFGISASPLDLALVAFGFDPGEGREILIRTGIILLGSSLIIIGIAMIISGSKTVRNVSSAVVDTAVDLIPAGKVAKIAKKVT